MEMGARGNASKIQRGKTILYVKQNDIQGNREQAKIIKLTWADVRELVFTRIPREGSVYGVPRGGSVVAALTGRAVDKPEHACYIVDDILDSGRTRDKWRDRYPSKPFYILVDKNSDNRWRGKWVEFPWEEPADRDAEDNVVRMLEFIGEDPRREGLVDTPSRVVKAWKEMTVGYHQDPKKILDTEFHGNGYDEMIVCRDIEFYSCCEHHMLPFSGVAHVAYVPRGSVVGLSKMARLVDCFARRLQIQEKLTQQIANAMDDVLNPLGVGVTVKAKHLCMSCRGVQKDRAEMVTTCLLGVFKKAAVRAEFFSHCR